MKIGKTISRFLYEELLPAVLTPAAPLAVNLRDEFRRFIQEEGVVPGKSDEISDDHFGQLCDAIARHMSDWDAQGIPRPITQSDQMHVFLAWPHDRFRAYSGLAERIDREFCEAFEYIQSLDGNQFLVICALWLKCIGFGRIFICDQPGDEGVDILGCLDEGGLRSLIAVVQAKTSNRPIGRGIVLSEYGKYMMLSHTEKYMSYRRALNLDNGVQGNSWNYMLLSNQSFLPTAQVASRHLGILLRSVHQIAYSLSRKCDVSQIRSEVDRFTPLSADLSRNISPQLLEFT